MADKKKNMTFAAIENAFKNFDARSLQKLTSPNAAEDLNTFLEKMPQNAGQTMLIIAAVLWSGAAATGLFTVVTLQSLTQLRAELQEAQAIRPLIPVVQQKPIQAASLKSTSDRMKEIYKGLTFNANGANVSMSAKTTAAFGQFREALGHIQSGGNGWKVSVESLCVGRECKNNALSATLRVNTVSVRAAQ